MADRKSLTSYVGIQSNKPIGIGELFYSIFYIPYCDFYHFKSRDFTADFSPSDFISRGITPHR